MKFTKEDAFKQIEGYLTDNGKKELLLSARSVNSALDTLMPLLADDETELSVFIEKVKPTFQTMYGNLKYDTTRFVKKWQDEHPEPQVEEAKAETPEPDPVLARIEKLEAEIQRRDKESAIAKKKTDIAKALADKGVKDSAWISSLLDEVTIAEGMDVESAADKYLKLYNRVSTNTPPNVSPGAAATSGKSGNPFQDVADDRKARREAEKGVITTN